MLKSKFIFGFMLSLFSVGAVQAQNITDPGVSSNNYKHPNKASKAKALEKEKSIPVANANTIERQQKRNSRGISSTPKYAPRTAGLVVETRSPKENVEINSLNSPRNYKTNQRATSKKANEEIADLNNVKDSIDQVTVD